MSIEVNKPLEVRYGDQFEGDLEVNEARIRAMRSAAMNSNDLQTAEALKERVAELVHMNTVLLCGTKLATVNRLFSRAAKRLGVDLTAVWGELLVERRISELETPGARVAVAPLVADEVRSFAGVETYIESTVPNFVRQAR